MYTGSKWMTTAEIICLTAIPNISFPNKTLPQCRIQTERNHYCTLISETGQALKSKKKAFFHNDKLSTIRK